MAEQQGTRKRRVCEDGEVVKEEEEEEDEKVDKFYALIRSYRDARESRRMELEAIGMEKIRMMTMMNKNVHKSSSGSKKEEAAAWVPRFKWEDFTEKIEFGSAKSDSGTGVTSWKRRGKTNEDGLDLKLSL